MERQTARDNKRMKNLPAALVTAAYAAGYSVVSIASIEQLGVYADRLEDCVTAEYLDPELIALIARNLREVGVWCYASDYEEDHAPEIADTGHGDYSYE